MKYIPEVIGLAAVVSIIGYVLVSSKIWIVILIASLIASIAYFLVDQERKTRKNT